MRYKKQFSALLVGALGIGVALANAPIAKAADATSVTDGVTTFAVVTNPGGPTISYVPGSGVDIITVDSSAGKLSFKDYNANGKLDAFEDWRNSVEVRAKALAQVMSIKQIAGLMLFSSHERNLAAGLTDTQKTYLKQDRLRNVLNASANDVTANVTWTNAAQAYAESLASADEPYIPVNISSDPRSTAGSDQAYNSEGADISRWPSNIGLAATFSEDAMLQFAKITSAEYRAMGITTALGPQIDLATEPRWLRVDGTFGENVSLATTMATAYVNGSQNTYDAKGKSIGWGQDSISTMIKHWPGDGAGEGGRESHMNAGKYAVYPGKNFKEPTKIFLAAKNSMAVMSSYSIAIAKDGSALTGNRVGSAYDKVKIDLLRNSKYDGVICTDWGVTTGYTDPNSRYGMAWGMENASVQERHYAVLKAGVDMYGGNNATAPVLAAYDMWQADYEAGKVKISADARFRQSGERILRMIMAPGLFENPYLDLAKSKTIVASDAFVAAGLKTQADSVVMLKNSHKVIRKTKASAYADKVVYIPSSIGHGFTGVFGTSADVLGPTLDVDVAKTYFKEVRTDTPVLDASGNVVDYTMPDLTGVDMVLMGMRGPDNGNNFTGAGMNSDGTFYPLSLQWGSYTANGKHVRKKSIAGDILADGSQQNRSYYGATSKIGNEYDLTALNRTITAVDKLNKANKAAAKKSHKKAVEVPVIVSVKAKTSFIPAEFESRVDALLVGYSLYDKVLIDASLGLAEPHGRLPMTSPKNMDAVEAQLEDVGEDMKAYKDSAGNVYAFGFGLDWKGRIRGKW